MPPQWQSPMGDAHYRDVKNALEKKQLEIDSLRRLSAKLLNELRHSTTDRADSPLPEWEAEAERLGVFAC